MYLYTAERRDVLGNIPPTPERFPEGNIQGLVFVEHGYIRNCLIVQGVVKYRKACSMQLNGMQGALHCRTGTSKVKCRSKSSYTRDFPRVSVRKTHGLGKS